MSPNSLWWALYCVVHAYFTSCFKGTLQAKYKFTSFYRTLHADLRSAISFCMYRLVYKIFAVKWHAKFHHVDLTRHSIKEWSDCENCQLHRVQNKYEFRKVHFEPILMMMATSSTDADIDNMDQLAKNMLAHLLFYSLETSHLACESKFPGTTHNSDCGNVVGTAFNVSFLRLLCPQSCSARFVSKLSGEKWAEPTKEYWEGHWLAHKILASHTAFWCLSCRRQWYKTPAVFFEWLVHPGTIYSAAFQRLINNRLTTWTQMVRIHWWVHSMTSCATPTTTS